MPENNKIFRQEALERLSSPEKLDRTLKVVNPKAWIPLATAGSLIAVGLIWSVFGRIPLSANGRGVLIRPNQIVSFQSPSEGQLTELKIEPGATIKKGDVLGIIDQGALKQQLEQEQAKLTQLLALDKNSSELQNKQLAGERTDSHSAESQFRKEFRAGRNRKRST